MEVFFPGASRGFVPPPQHRAAAWPSPPLPPPHQQQQRGSPHTLPRPGGLAVAHEAATIIWVTLAEDEPSSLTLEELLPAVAPVLINEEPLQSLLPYSHFILEQLVGGNVDELTELRHDPGWDTYPEVGRALAAAGGGEQCLCLSVCPARSKWAVGVASKWKHRENVARLALCVALSFGARNFEGITARCPPGFAALCADAGAAAAAMCASGSPAALLPGHGKGRKRGWGGPPLEVAAAMAPAPGAAAAYGPRPPDRPPPPGLARGTRKVPAVAPRAAAAAVEQDALELPRVLWLSIDGNSKLVDEELLPPMAPALVHDASIDTNLCSHARSLLAELAGEDQVELRHDTDWDLYPEVGEALKAKGVPELCLCVAVCTARSLWAVGVASKWKLRESIARLALCVALTHGDNHTDVHNKVVASWPEFQALCKANEVLPSDWKPPPPDVERRVKKTKVVMATSGDDQERDEVEDVGEVGIDATPAVEEVPEPAADEELGACWVHLTGPSRLTDEESLPGMAPALGQNTPGVQGILSASRDILAAFAGEDAEHVELRHDTDWDVYPEVGNALKNAGGEEQSLCLAINPARGMWAVGTAGKWRVRENVARLALCVALAFDDADDQLETIVSKWPDFGKVCAGLGLSTPAVVALPPRLPPSLPPPPRRVRAGAGAAASDASPPGKGMPGCQLPRDVPLWIELPSDSEAPATLAGLPTTALALSTDSARRKGLYAKDHDILAHVAGGELADVEYHDDANWEHFLEVGTALKRHADVEECLNIAVLPSRSLWAVGVAMKGKCRFSAAKVALAAALAMQLEDDGDEAPDVSEFPAFAEFLEEAKVARP